MPPQWAERIRSERARCGLNQSDFARAGGVTRTSQVAYENGTTPPTIAYLLKLEDIGVDASFILTGERASGLLDDTDRRLIATLPSLSMAQKAVLLQLAEMLAAGGHDPPQSSEVPAARAKARAASR